jgi:hypothetical protein
VPAPGSCPIRSSAVRMRSDRLLAPVGPHIRLNLRNSSSEMRQYTNLFLGLITDKVLILSWLYFAWE